MRNVKVGIGLLVTALLVITCAKLPPTPAKTGTLMAEKISETDSVPDAWGKLISATISSDFPRQVQLWFQDEKGEIRLAFYDMPQNRLMPEVLIIRRK